MTTGVSIWVSIQLNQSGFKRMKHLMSSVFGGTEMYSIPGLSVFQIGEESIVQLYGPGAVYPPYLFSKGETVLGIKVKNIHSCIVELENCGAKLLSDVYIAGDCLSFLYFKLPDGKIFALYEQKLK